MMTKTSEITFLIHDLGDHDGFVAQRARKKLEQLGSAAVPALVQTLQVGSERARWEAAKALEHMYTPEAADALVAALEDNNQCVQWLAAKALIKLGTTAYTPLLNALVIHPDRTRLRHGAHHVLSEVFMMPAIKPYLMAVYEALDRKATPSDVRVAAADALGRLEG